MTTKSILTLNILGIQRKQKETLFPKRLNHILQKLSALSPDVICLQEVPDTHLNLIEGWAKEQQLTVTCPDQTEIQCITLSKEHPISSRCLKLPNKTPLDYHVVSTNFIWGTILHCHLHHGAENQQIRNNQLEFIHKHFLYNNPSDVVLCGDFNINFFSSSVRNSDTNLHPFPKKIREKWTAFEDAIAALHIPTQSPENPLSKPKKVARPDGIFLINKKNIDLQKSERAFTESLPSPLQTYSDHYGLLTKIHSV